MPRLTTEEHLINALKLSYKHAQGDISAGTSETIDSVANALCNLIGDQAFCEFVDSDVLRYGD